MKTPFVKKTTPLLLVMMYVSSFVLQGRSEGGPGVPVTPLCKAFLRKKPTIFSGENAMTIMFDTV